MRLSAAGSGVNLAAVFLDGDYEDADYYVRWARAADLLVAADGGARFLAAAGLVPHLLVGDFDSLEEAAVREAGRRGARVVRHPVRKDQTDGELAVAEALSSGARDVALAGALGALDHVLGHLALLARTEAAGVPARLVAPRLTVRVLLAPRVVSLDAAPGTRVSLSPLGGDAVVTLEGLDYPLERGRLPGEACLGLGNAVAAVGDVPGRRAPASRGGARVEVHEGRVALLVASGAESFGELCLPRALGSGP